MSDLHLDSLEIKNFRCFEHLVIPKLGRVNLIVGKNSVGKTALLEALWLLNTNADWAVIHKILYDRNELVRYGVDSPLRLSEANSLDRQEQIEAMTTFFWGRPPIKREIREFFDGHKRGIGEILVSHFKTKDNSFELGLAAEPQQIYFEKENPLIILRTTFPSLPQKLLLEYKVIDISKKYKTTFIPLKGLSWETLSTYWDDITLTDKEVSIVECLQLVEPGIRRLTFKGENMQDRIRYPVGRTIQFPEPIALANLGEGVQRILAIALAMSIVSGGYLLVDEFETGLHHWIQADVWRAVFKLAKEWNIQVFATTHSWDCVEAFQQAAAEDQNEEAMLIRLQRKRDGTGIEAINYDERRLAIATRQSVEVR